MFPNTITSHFNLSSADQIISSSNDIFECLIKKGKNQRPLPFSKTLYSRNFISNQLFLELFPFASCGTRI